MTGSQLRRIRWAALLLGVLLLAGCGERLYTTPPSPEEQAILDARYPYEELSPSLRSIHNTLQIVCHKVHALDNGAEWAAEDGRMVEAEKLTAERARLAARYRAMVAELGKLPPEFQLPDNLDRRFPVCEGKPN